MISICSISLSFIIFYLTFINSNLILFCLLPLIINYSTMFYFIIYPFSRYYCFFCYFIIILIYLILAFYHFTNFHYIIHFKILDLIFIHFFNHYTNFPHNRNFHLHYSTIFQILIFFHFSSALDKYIRPLLMNKY